MRSPDYRAAILEGLQTLSQQNKRGPRPSSAGACPKKIYWDWVGAEGENKERSLLSPLVGTGVHVQFEHALKESLGWQTETPICIDCNGFQIKGSMDLCGPYRIGDLKVVGPKTWWAIRSRAKKEHIDQINLYAWAADKLEFDVIYIELAGLIGYWQTSRDGLTPHERELRMRVYTHQTSERDALEVVGKFEAVYAHVVAGTEFPAPYFEPRPFPCGWCEYQTRCWSQEELEVLEV